MATSAREHTARQQVLTSCARFWSTSEVAAAPGLLGQLARSGELVRVRRGLYWRGRATPLGMSPPPLQALAEHLAGTRGVGPAGLSAAHHLRLSTQVPRRDHIAVPARAPAPVGAVQFVSRAARTGRHTSELTPTEVAVLEVLDQWERVLEMPAEQAWSLLGDLLATGAVRPERLVAAAGTEPARVRSRLGELLTRSGVGPGRDPPHPPPDRSPARARARRPPPRSHRPDPREHHVNDTVQDPGASPLCPNHFPGATYLGELVPGFYLGRLAQDLVVDHRGSALDAVAGTYALFVEDGGCGQLLGLFPTTPAPCPVDTVLAERIAAAEQACERGETEDLPADLAAIDEAHIAWIRQAETCRFYLRPVDGHALLRGAQNLGYRAEQDGPLHWFECWLFDRAGQLAAR